MNTGTYNRPPSHAAQQPLPQNRQAFGTVSRRPTAGFNSAQPMGYQGGAQSGMRTATPQPSPSVGFGGFNGQHRLAPGALGGMQGGVSPGVSSVPQFGQFPQASMFPQMQPPQQFQGMSGVPQQPNPGMEHYWNRQRARYGLSGVKSGVDPYAMQQWQNQRYGDPQFQQRMDGRLTL